MFLSMKQNSLCKNTDNNLLWQLLLQPHGALQQNPEERKIFIIVLYSVQEINASNIP